MIRLRTAIEILVLATALLLTLQVAKAQNPNTAAFPTAVATDTDLLVAQNSARTTLNGAITSGATSITVTNASVFTTPTAVTIDSEVIKVCSQNNSTNVLTVCSSGRGFHGTAASHASLSTVVVFIDQYYTNQLAAEVKAIETQLGASMANVPLVSGAYANPTWITSLAMSKLTGTLSQNLTFTSDATYDIGASGANRPRSLYLSQSLFAPTVNVGLSNAGSTGVNLFVVDATPTTGVTQVVVRAGPGQGSTSPFRIQDNSASDVLLFQYPSGPAAPQAMLYIRSNTGQSSNLHFGEAGVAHRGSIGFVNGSGDMQFETGGSYLTAGAIQLKLLLAGGVQAFNHLTFGTDATYDIGASGANRPRNGFFSGTVTAPSFAGNASTATALATTVTHAHVKNSTSQSIAAGGADVVLTWDTDVTNVGSTHSTGTNPSRLTAQVTGTYIIVAQAEFNGGNSTGLNLSVSIRKNGATLLAKTLVLGTSDVSAVGRQVTWCGDLSATDYVEIIVNVGSANSDSVTAANTFAQIAQIR